MISGTKNKKRNVFTISIIFIPETNISDYVDVRFDRYVVRDYVHSIRETRLPRA